MNTFEKVFIKGAFKFFGFSDFAGGGEAKRRHGKWKFFLTRARGGPVRYGTVRYYVIFDGAAEQNKYGIFEGNILSLKFTCGHRHVGAV